jgi:hypothetical protein
MCVPLPLLDDVKQARCLALGALALGIALSNFVARIAFANHVDSSATTYHLAVGMTKFQGTD